MALEPTSKFRQDHASEPRVVTVVTRTHGHTPPTQITRLYPPQRPSSSLNPSHPFTHLLHCKARPSGLHNIPPASARSVTGSSSYVNVPTVAPDPPWGVWDTTVTAELLPHEDRARACDVPRKEADDIRVREARLNTSRR
jgi:hypothetical protein